MLGDLRLAARRLLRAPGFAAAAALTLALGLGANTTMFSLVSAVFLRPLPVQEPDRLLRVVTTWRDGDGRSINSGALGWDDVPALAARRDVFAGVAAFGNAKLAMGEGEHARTVHAALVTGQYFGVLGVRAAIGRAIGAGDVGAPGASPVVVLSHALWAGRFGGDSSLVGRAVSLNGKPHTVVGVAPPTFRGTEIENVPEVWLPATQGGALGVVGPRAYQRGSRWLHGLARLAPGVARAEAGAAAARLGGDVARDYPDSHRGWGVRVVAGGTLLAADPSEHGPVFAVFGALTALALLVLAVTAANVANLQLARAASRRRELSLRVALGAGRARLVREVVAESALLAGAAALVAAVLGAAGASLLPRLGLPPMLDLAPDRRVLGATAALALGTGLLFGLVPALWVTRGSLTAGIKDGTAGAGRSRSRLRGALVVGQMAVSMVLLVSAGLLLRTVSALRDADVGYEPHGVLSVALDAGTRGYDATRGLALYEQLLARVRALPNVRAATLHAIVPLSGNGMSQEVRLPARGGAVQRTQYDVVADGFVEALGMRAADGRMLGAQDRPGAPRAVVVNEAFARRAWPGQRAVGQRVRLEGERGDEATVVGVVRDARVGDITGRPEPTMLLPLAQEWTSGMTLEVRVAAGAPHAVLGAVRRELRALDPDLPTGEVRTLEEVRTQAMFPARLMATLMTAFGALALAVAAVGLAGVVAFAVAQRTREMGVRLALGAAGADVERMVVGEGMRLAVLGVGVGLAAAAGVARLLSAQLYGVGAGDPATYLLVAAALSAVALLAAWLPARRASRVDPLVALRAE
ncbi:ADOP family duplicated permease [Roseisolibacter sp. H3M3-2]|uniref:ADOP family duplicated permease n=1 Tax=Roseisolibacter sp. H3M3-2 TaxID=3031323 RepID=UPI0023DA7589|nr:ADOP family duplicated permease [Roseisolibacter sp. H3M3-2]MDF1504466.1 ADOP family duplicated permease [Roseisolibacter sp. H3M3-2]